MSHLTIVALSFIATLLSGCVAFEPTLQSTIDELAHRPFIAILPIGFDLDITSLSSVKSIEDTLSPEQEAIQLVQALGEIRQEARWS
jgi:hypothetical protein